jgi:hypothetical protein
LPSKPELLSASHALAKDRRTGIKRHQSFEASGAGAPGAGASWTGAGVCCGGGAACFVVAGFLAAATAGAADAAGRAGGDGALGVVDGALARGTAGAALGSGFMILIGGVEAAVGNSALVGLPVGINGESMATGAAAAEDAFHDGA